MIKTIKLKFGRGTGLAGLFVVRKGEIESWLLPLGVTGHGANWLIKIKIFPIQSLNFRL